MMRSRGPCSTCRLCSAIAAAGALAAAPQPVRADDSDGVDVLDDEHAPSAGTHSAEAGAFLISALSPRSEGRRGLVTVSGGWDRARDGAIYDTTIEANLLGPLSLSAGALHDGPGTSASTHFELRLDALHQARHGLDLAIAGGYTDAGLNTVPAAVLRLAVGRNVGASYLLANVVYDHGLEEGERSGELRLAALYPVARAVHIGIDSRLQIDLERDSDEPSGEVDWDWRSGLVASYAWNQFVFTGGGGISALRLRSGGPTAVGPVVTAGLGTVF